jgi:hypothetical protein
MTTHRAACRCEGEPVRISVRRSFERQRLTGGIPVSKHSLRGAGDIIGSQRFAISRSGIRSETRKITDRLSGSTCALPLFYKSLSA